MEFDLEKLKPKLVHNLLLSSVMPRPIALTTTIDVHGRVNAAPFSYFNVVSVNPPLLALGIEIDPVHGRKHTSANIAATGEFVVNLVDDSMAEAMIVCATDFPEGRNELEEAGLETEPSLTVRPPRIARSPVSLECRTFHTLDLGDGHMVQIGRVLHMRVKDHLVLNPERAYLDGAAMHLIGRMHGNAAYVRTTDLFDVKRRSFASLAAAQV